mmetsp:Transcript_36159/g.144551  ORF Transcript_36159/g.144551 Transcript_36159/m.144551 type:complete len:99 (-) Transcript_36159:70-366(-)
MSTLCEVLVFSAADLELWELEEERAKLCGKERRENHGNKFKVLEFRTVHSNYDAAQKRAPVRAENSSYPQRPPGPLAMVCLIAAYQPYYEATKTVPFV